MSKVERIERYKEARGGNERMRKGKIYGPILFRVSWGLVAGAENSPDPPFGGFHFHYTILYSQKRKKR